MLDILNWHTAADSPPDRVPLLCYCESDNSIFLGFAIHPYLPSDRTISIVNWYEQTGLHEWHTAEKIVTRWAEMKFNSREGSDDELHQNHSV